MSEVIETDLPSIGKKFQFKLAGGSIISVIVHIDGKKNLYLRERENSEPIMLSFTDEEARKLGGILSGAYFKPTVVEQLETALTKKAGIRWFRISSTSPLSGKMIKELDVRRKSGVSIIAINRGGETIPNPDANLTINPDDILVVIGTQENMQKFETMLLG